MTPAAILLVEDNMMNQKLAKTLLEIEGYVVHVASAGAEALTILDTTIPDLILTDIQMPGMDGLELTRIIKGRPDTRHVPVVAVTAYAMRGDRDRFMAAGCDGYISKPIDATTFVHVVASHLERARANPGVGPS